MKNFEHCFPLLIKSEGGYSNVKGDNGGPTNFGITIADYRKYINPRGTATDVKNMSMAQAQTIYRQKYWDALDCDDLPSGVDYTCFDYGVNSGLGRPRKALQQFKGKTGVDLINAINDERTAFLTNLADMQAHDAQFKQGWLSRVARVRAESLKMNKTVPVAPKAAGGVIGMILTGAVSAYHWGIEHWQMILGGSLTLGLITYALIHLYHKVK